MDLESYSLETCLGTAPTRKQRRVLVLGTSKRMCAYLQR